MMAEAKPAVSEGTDIIHIIKYLREREAELARYSDKLRKSVKRLMNVFGWDDFCQICNEHVDKHSADHEFVPKIYVSIDLRDEEPFYVGEDYELRLFLEHGSLVTRIITINGTFARKDVDEMPREAVKKLVTSGRLLKFIEKIRERLDETTEEYKRVSEIAEKLAKCVQA